MDDDPRREAARSLRRQRSAAVAALHGDRRHGARFGVLAVFDELRRRDLVRQQRRQRLQRADDDKVEIRTRIDAAERVVQGQQLATVRIGYTYAGSYERTERFGYNGNGTPITTDRTRRDVTIWQTDHAWLGVVDGASDALGGWTLSAHHVYDPHGPTLWTGDGRQHSYAALTVNRTFAGNGGTPIARVTGDGQPHPPPVDGPALERPLGHPYGLAVDRDGVVFVTTYEGYVFRIGPDGGMLELKRFGQVCFGLDAIFGTPTTFGGFQFELHGIGDGLVDREMSRQPR